MRKLLLLTFISLFVLLSNAQTKTCKTNKDDIVAELNTITKCAIGHSKKSNKKSARQISVRVSAPKKRFLKKRILLKKEDVKGANNLSVAGVKSKSPSELSKSIGLKKIASISSTLSAEEVRKAERFTNVDVIPTFKNCKDDKQLDCFNIEMIKHIEKHFNYPNDAVLKKIQGDVWVRFIIDSNGNVTNIKTLGPENGELLNEEAKRVVSKLPTFNPGVKNGKNVSVKYGFPINFSLDQ